MFARGVVDEVREAHARGRSRTRPRKALGLDELATLPLDEARERIVARTRRYAAYQRKWMRRIPGIVMIDADRPPEEVADADPRPGARSVTRTSSSSPTRARLDAARASRARAATPTASLEVLARRPTIASTSSSGTPTGRRPSSRETARASPPRGSPSASGAAQIDGRRRRAIGRDTRARGRRDRAGPRRGRRRRRARRSTASRSCRSRSGTRTRSSSAIPTTIGELGPLLETHARFPNRTNVQVARVDAPGEVTARVWERGVGETRVVRDERGRRRRGDARRRRRASSTSPAATSACASRTAARTLYGSAERVA